MTKGGREISDLYQDALAALSRLLFYLGLGVTTVCSGLLVFLFFRVGSPDAANQVSAAQKNAQTFTTFLVPGTLALGIGAATLFWGYEVMIGLLLLGSAILYFAPLWVPMVGGEPANDAARTALGGLQTGGTVLGLIAIAVTVISVALKVIERAKYGAKADQIKIGKGVREEVDVQNVFLGKCYQMPFCRKYVRERCPLFHTRRACWKERSGCMCEQKIIADAVADVKIPKDAVLAAKYIPRNGRLTNAEKAERCRNCVIYNERQRQKYQAALPILIVSFLAIYGIGRVAGLETLRNGVVAINKAVNSATMGATGTASVPTFVIEGLYAVCIVLALSYALKIAEFAIFKLKL